MPVWGWILVGLGVAFVILVVIFTIKEGKKKRYALENGAQTHGWLVQANNALFEDGLMDNPGLVIISPDKKTNDDRDFMSDLADQIMELKTEEGDTKAERKVSRLMADETYVEGKRDKLPEELTKGKTVFLVHIMIYRDHLPGKKLRHRKVYCAIVWDEPSTMVCTRPYPDDEEDEEDEE